MKDRVDLEKSQESSLADEFSIVKDNVSKMKDIFKVLEQDFRMK
jgi:inositol 1,4,5-triphosphate receptor type 1